MSVRSVVLLLALLAAPAAEAGLRPLYGGEAALVVPSEPQAADPALAWTQADLAVACATGAPLEALLASAPAVEGTRVRLRLRPELAWPDGRPVDAKSVVAALEAALRKAAVALPPLAPRTDQDDVVLELPPGLDAPAVLALPWLRLPTGGAFALRGLALEATVAGPVPRPYLDRVRLEVREGRRIEPAAAGLALARSGGEGRLVFAVVRPGSPAAPALRGALARLNREALVQFFVRTPARVPADWPLPAEERAPAPREPVLFALDGSQRDPVAERLQVILRDRRIPARVVSSGRAEHARRLSQGAFDLALVAVPPAPLLVQTATLLKLLDPASVDEAWTWKPASDAPLREAAARTGAVLLYVEGGAVAAGPRVRAGAAPGCPVDLASTWLLPTGAPP